MSDDDTGKKVGLVGVGLAGLLGLLAKMEHCAVAGGKAVAPAVHLAEDGARVGARAMPLAGEGAALGVGVSRAAGAGRTTLGKVATGGRVFEGSGLRAVPLVLAEDAARVGKPPAGLALLEHGGAAVEATSDLAGYAFDAATLVVDDDTAPLSDRPYIMAPAVSGRSALIALTEGPTQLDLPAQTTLVMLRPVQIHGLNGLLSSFPLFRRTSPVVIVGRGQDSELRIPEGTPTSASAIASSCAAAAVVCAVVVPKPRPRPASSTSRKRGRPRPARCRRRLARRRS